MALEGLKHLLNNFGSMRLETWSRLKDRLKTRSRRYPGENPYASML